MSNVERLRNHFFGDYTRNPISCVRKRDHCEVPVKGAREKRKRDTMETKNKRQQKIENNKKQFNGKTFPIESSFPQLRDTD